MAVLVLAALALVAAIFITGYLAIATAQKGGARHGADAAALAGAQAVVDAIPMKLAPGFLSPTEIPERLGGGRCLQNGRAEAARLAGANGDHLTSYCYDAFTDEIAVSVSGDDGARAEATAATSFDAGSCTLDPGFTAPSEDPSARRDDSTPSPPAPVHSTIDCGITGLLVTYDPVDARFHFVGLQEALADVKPRLTR